MLSDDRAHLEHLLRGNAVSAAWIPRLADYGALLLEANRRVNLTGAHDPPTLIPHLLDSLSLVPFVAGPLVDVGSGGGLPAMPLAVACGIDLTLVEAIRKKAAFLEEAAAELGLGARVVSRRAEDAGRDPALREAFACATARAVASAPAVLELTVPFLRIGGRALLQRGALDERERNALHDAAPMLGARISQEVLLGGDRRIVVAEKLAATPERFPRRAGIPEKRPLCY